MLYTIGHRENYLKAIENSDDGYIFKIGKNSEYDGGFVTDNLQDCRKAIEQFFASKVDQFAIFGLEGVDYEKDTYQKENEWFRRLLVDAKIIIWENEEN